MPDSGTDRAPGRGVEDHRSGRLLDGRYLLGVRIARGGMASVYEAVDTRLDRTVAVKIMHPGLGDATPDAEESFARRFVREARAAARLSHPHVVGVHDQGRDADGTVYLVMEFVPGHTLRDAVAEESPMAPERALALLDPVLSALGSAHRAGLVHRDVKPENVLIGDDGSIKVADFGLARAVSAETQHTATTGVLIGTVSYLAPEIVTAQQADARADVYAAGVVLFELLTGEKPHTGETPIAVAFSHVHNDVPAPSSLVGSIPDYVDALVARATTRDPSLRPADASVLLHHVRRVAQALREGLTGDPDLVDDLMPPRRVADDAAPAVTTDTTPESVDALLVAAAPVATTARGGAGTVGGASDSRRERTAVIGADGTLRPAGPARPSVATAVPLAATPPPRRRRGRLLLAALLVVLLAAAGGAGYWFGWGRYASAPAVVGLPQAAAVAALEDAGLRARVAERVYSETVAKGVVVAADPGTGDRVLPDDTVGLTVSLGPERYDLPDLAGLTLEQAGDRLGEVKMVLGAQAGEFSETVPEGRIIRTDPAFGSPEAAALPVRTAVAVVVSQGRQPIEVRSYVGRKASSIIATLTKRGLAPEVGAEEFSDTVAEGRIISQTPESGSLFRGDKVTFVVSKGPELVTIPSVRYSSTSSVVAKLEALGLKVKIEREMIYLSGQVAWNTNPRPGTKVRKGSTIVLTVV